MNENEILDATRAERMERIGRSGRFMNIMVDWAFKRVFGTPANADILLEFINDLFEGRKKIKHIEYLPTELLGESEEDRSGVVDIRCRDENEDEYIIEMQVHPHDNFHRRIFYYGSKIVAESLKRGKKDWAKVKGVICIALMNFTVKDDPNPRTEVYFTDSHGNTEKYDLFRMIFIQIPRYKIKKLEDTRNNYEKWIFLLSNMRNMKDYPIDLEKEKAAFLEFLRQADVKAMTQSERAAYEYTAKKWDYHIAMMEYAVREGKEEGKQLGITEGREIGIKQGIKQGIEQGIEKEKLEIAKKMKGSGMEASTISELTGLNIKEVLAL